MADILDRQSQGSTTQSSSSQSRYDPRHNDAAPAAAAAAAGHSDADSSYVPRPKRIACVVCRRRKLRCDGKKPSCGTCSRLGHECAYDEVRKKSGPKRGYVKQLEARLAQVETLLQSQEGAAPQPQGNGFAAPAPNELTSIPEDNSFANVTDTSISPPEGPTGYPQLGLTYMPPVMDQTSHFGWDMISLGLEEPLPSWEVIDELNQIYFAKIHPGIPILHRPRHLAAMNMAPNVRPPVSLQYITWCHAASVSDKYFNLHELFYQRARRYAELDEMKGFGEGILSLTSCQTWLLIGTYEFRMMYFPRAWLSVGKASRLALMLGLNRIDAQNSEVKQTLPPAKDWTEKEERRRAFWMAFCVDRYASVGTGWPVLIDERDVMTNLPATEEAFIKSKPQRTLRVTDIAQGDGIPTLSTFGSVAFMAYLFGRNLSHLHRPDPQENEHDLNGVFWQRHRSHDNILLHFALAMPNHLRLPAGVGDPNVIFCNMAIHTSTICLHQAAIFKAEKNKISEQIITESKRRCIVAADQVSNIMKMISHMDLTIMNPFMAFCVYVAARVFVQYLKSRSDDSAARSSLQFLFSALGALKSKNPLTESFLAQLEVDIEGTAFRDLRDFHNHGSKKSRTTYDDQEDTNNGDKTNNKYTPILPMCPMQSRTSFPTSTSLPCRHKPPTPSPQARNLNPNPSSLHTTNLYNLPAGPRPGQSTVIDMDLSPEYTDTSTSDLPSNNSSTNSNPITAADEAASSVQQNQPRTRPQHPSSSTFLPTSPPKQQQQQPHQSSILNGHTPRANTNNPLGNNNNPEQMQLPLDNIVPGPYIDMFASGPYATGIVTPLDSTGSEGSAMPMPPPPWDFVSAQDPNADGLDMAGGGGETFNEAQWAQLLGSTSWDAWRT